MDVTSCLKKYSDNYYENMFGFFGEVNAKGQYKAEQFLKNYALSDSTFRQECLPVMQKVFKPFNTYDFDIRKCSFDTLFHDGFRTFFHVSSPMFTEESYLYLQKISKACGDNYFYIVEDSDDDFAFQLKIPTTTRWKKLMSGGFISSVLFHMPYNIYRIFGDSGFWGKLCNYDNPWVDYEIFGSKLDMMEVRNYHSLMKLSENELSFLPEEIRMIAKER